MPAVTFDVSVVIPCYNQGRFLADAVRSALGQQPLNAGDSPPRVEVIVVDDGSTDDTAEVARQFAGQITYIEKANAGVCAARNTGILESRGAFLNFLDADDWVAPDFYAHLLRAAKERPEIGIFYGSCQLTDEFKNPSWTRRAEPLPDSDTLHAWLRQCHLSCHSALVRREALALTRLWDGQFRSAEDWDLWIRMAASGVKFFPAPEAVCMYRRYADSKSRGFEMAYRNGTRMLRTHGNHHGRCPACRRALRDGLRYFRRYCLENAYWHTFGAIRRSDGLPAAACFVARTCAREPLLLFEVARHAVRQRGRGARRDDAAIPTAPATRPVT